MLDSLGKFIVGIFIFSGGMHIITTYTIFGQWL